MEQRISIITLGVADLKRSGAFFERMGWRRSAVKTDGILFFQTGGMALALYRGMSSPTMRMLLPTATVSTALRSPTTRAVGKKSIPWFKRQPRQERGFSSLLRRPSGAAIRGIFPTLTGSYGRSPGIHSSRSQVMEGFEFRIESCKSPRLPRPSKSPPGPGPQSFPVRAPWPAPARARRG